MGWLRWCREFWGRRCSLLKPKPSNVSCRLYGLAGQLTRNLPQPHQRYFDPRAPRMAAADADAVAVPLGGGKHRARRHADALFASAAKQSQRLALLRHLAPEHKAPGGARDSRVLGKDLFDGLRGLLSLAREARAQLTRVMIIPAIGHELGNR